MQLNSISLHNPAYISGLPSHDCFMSRRRARSHVSIQGGGGHLAKSPSAPSSKEPACVSHARSLARLGSSEVGYFAQGHSLQTADGPGQGSNPAPFAANCEVRKKIPDSGCLHRCSPVSRTCCNSSVNNAQPPCGVLKLLRVFGFFFVLFFNYQDARSQSQRVPNDVSIQMLTPCSYPRGGRRRSFL